MAGGSIHCPTSKADMFSVFPDPPQAIIGEVNVNELFRLMRHMIPCAQSHETPSNNGLNLLHKALPEAVYRDYLPDPINQIYPPPLQNPGSSPVFVVGADPAALANARLQWELANKLYRDERTMDSALIDRWVSLFPEQYQGPFQNERTRNPNMTFLQCVHHFFETYGNITEQDREDNKTKMASTWTFADGWDRLRMQIEDGLMWANFVGRPISDEDAVDIAMKHILQTGLFANEYGEWHALPDIQKTWPHFKNVWSAKYRLKKTTAIAASKLGYGMNATEGEDDPTLQASVDNFSAAHAATQNTISQLSTQNAQLQNAVPAIQQQLNQMAQMVQQLNLANQQQAPSMPYQQQGTYYGGRGGGRGGGGRGRRYRGGRGGGRGGGERGGFPGMGRPVANANGYAPRNQAPTPVKRFENWNYCWSCGFDVERSHTSATCPNMSWGHQHNATRANPMGGSMRAQHKTMLPSSVGRQSRDTVPPLGTFPPGGPPQPPSAPAQQQFGAYAQQATGYAPPPLPQVSSRWRPR